MKHLKYHLQNLRSPQPRGRPLLQRLSRPPSRLLPQPNTKRNAHLLMMFYCTGYLTRTGAYKLPRTLQHGLFHTAANQPMRLRLDLVPPNEVETGSHPSILTRPRPSQRQSYMQRYLIRQRERTVHRVSACSRLRRGGSRGIWRV